MKVGDALNKSGSSREEKDKCPWYDDLDKILGTRPTVCPVDIVESYVRPTDETASSRGTPSPPGSSIGEVPLDGNGECMSDRTLHTHLINATIDRLILVEICDM